MSGLRGSIWTSLAPVFSSLPRTFCEGLAAVGGAVEAALGVGAVGVAEDGDEELVGIARIDGDLRDLLAVAQAEVGPGLAGVGGFVDAVADGEIGTLESFAAADVDDVGIGGSDGESADGAGGLVVEDGVPGAAVVGGLPDAAVADADVEDVGLGGDALGGFGASGAQGSDGTPAHFGKHFAVVGGSEGEGKGGDESAHEKRGGTFHGCS